MATSLVPKIGAVGTLAQLSTGASGNTVLVGADGSAIFNDAGFRGASPSATAAVNSAAIQAALDAGGEVLLMSPGICNIDAPLLTGSNTRFLIGPGVTIRNGGTHQGVIVRTGNAEFSHGATSNGIAILAADTQAGGVGQMLYQITPARLSWKAPGDTAYGAAVDVSTAPGGKYTLESGSANKALHVTVATTVLAASGGTYNVKVSPVSGATSVALTRATSVVTAAETGHGRRSGDLIQIYGDSGFAGSFIIEVTGDDAYTYADSRADSTSSGARAYGLRNITIEADGAEFDAGFGTLLGAANGVLANAIVARNVTGLEITGGRTIKTAKYGVLVNACANYRVADWLRDLDSDTIHLTSPLMNGVVENITANGGDNIVGIGTSDYAGQIFDLPTEVGFIDVENLIVRNVTGINSSHDLVRFFGSAPGYIRNVTIDGVHGTFDSTATAAVRVMTDATLMYDGTAQTNIDDLKILNITAHGADSSLQLRQVYIDGAGTKRRIEVDGVAVYNNGNTLKGAVYINSAMDTLKIGRMKQAVYPFQGFGVSFGGAASIKDTHITKSELEVTNSVLSTTLMTAMIYCDQNAAILERVVIDECSQTDLSAAGTLSYLSYFTNDIRSVAYDNVFGKGCAAIGRFTSTVSAIKASITNAFGINGTVQAPDCVYSQANGGTINMANLSGSFTHGARLSGTSGTVKLRANNVGVAAYNGGSFLNASGGATYDVVSPDGTCVLSAIARTTGNMVKASTALGTIPVGALCVCDNSGAANSWKAVHNTALVY